MVTDLTLEMCTPSWRWIPEQRRQTNTPRLMDAQSGSGRARENEGEWRVDDVTICASGTTLHWRSLTWLGALSTDFVLAHRHQVTQARQVLLLVVRALVHIVHVDTHVRLRVLVPLDPPTARVMAARSKLQHATRKCLLTHNPATQPTYILNQSRPPTPLTERGPETRDGPVTRVV